MEPKSRTRLGWKDVSVGGWHGRLHRAQGGLEVKMHSGDVQRCSCVSEGAAWATGFCSKHCSHLGASQRFQTLSLLWDSDSGF